MARTNSRKVLILLGILFLLIGQINAKVIDVNLVFYDDSVQEIHLVVADKIPVELGGDYVLEVLSSAGEVIKRRELRIPSDLKDKISILSMRMSYREGMEILRLLHNGKEIYSRNIFAYVSGAVTTTTPATTLTTVPTTSTIPTTSTTISATTTLRVFNCGNSACDEMENYKNCPGDCPSGSSDKYCDGMDEGICDPDCYRWEDPDCESGTTTPTTIPTTIPTTTTLATTTIPTTIPTTVPTTILTTIPTTIPTTSSTTSTTTTSLPTTTTVQPEEKEEGLPILYIGAALLLIAAIAVVVIKIRPLKTLRKVDDGELRYWIEGKLKTGENPALLKKALEMQGSDPKIVDEIMHKIWKNSADVV